jgi:hypothetical protein
MSGQTSRFARRRCLTLLAAAAVMLLTSRAPGQVAAVEYSSSQVGLALGVSWVAGYQFRTTAPVFVTHLGAVLEPQTGVPSTSAEVGLWDDAGVLLLSTTVANTDPRTGHFRYHPVQSTAFAAGQTYTVAGLYAPNATVESTVFSQMTAPEVTYLAPRSRMTTGLAFPTSDVNGGLGNGKYGGSFLLVPVPEPGSLALTALAGVAVADYGRQYKPAFSARS